MAWIQRKSSPNRLLCITGAAGAGKTAIQQTLALHCERQVILASTFSFSAADDSRKDISRVIPSIAYQLGVKNNPFHQLVAQAILRDEAIFERDSATQMETLVVHPSQDLRNRETFSPYIILIDGFDCLDEGEQAELLEVIRQQLLEKNTVFLIAIASRPQLAIHTAVSSNGHLTALADHIQLSNEYDATPDIRHTLRTQLRRIGRESHDPDANNSSWPSDDDLERLVASASGQYIYAATVLKYVSEPRGGGSPSMRLRTILS